MDIFKFKLYVIVYRNVKRVYCSVNLGRNWFERFIAEWPDLVEFKTKGTIFRIQNDPISIKTWVHERDNYTRIQKRTKQFDCRTYIFVVETKKLDICRGNTVEFEVMVRICYN